MKYIGWDIGIKNMSYCLIEKLDTSLDEIKSSNNQDIKSCHDTSNLMSNNNSLNNDNSINNNDSNNNSNIIKKFSSETNNIFYLGKNVYKVLKWGVINIVLKVTEKEEEKGEIMLIHRPSISCSI